MTASWRPCRRASLRAVERKAGEDAREQSRTADEKARLAGQLSRDCIVRLKGDIESLHSRMRALEEEWAVAKGRASMLGKSWLPGKFHAKRLPGDEFLRAELFGDNGADLHGARITYHLYTSPYRILAPGKNSLAGWCHAEGETIAGVRVRLGSAEFPGNYPIDTAAVSGAVCFFDTMTNS